MPELPEVETVRRGLLATVLGRPVESVEVLSPQSLQASQQALERPLSGIGSPGSAGVAQSAQALCGGDGVSGLPVISLAPRPRVTKLNAQRVSTSSRFCRPIR
jgi:hypothetical protein